MENPGGGFFMLTIGEKIRYFRKKLGITQDQLASVTGIHPVSIRKYETNKMQPQVAQIERIADALHVNRSALDGFDTQFRMETVGDLYGLLMELHKSGILMLRGERNEEKYITPESAQFVPASPLAGYFAMQFSESKKKKAIQVNDFTLCLTDSDVLDKLIKWECFYGIYLNASKFIENADQTTLDNYHDLESTLEAIELELISCREPLAKE